MGYYKMACDQDRNGEIRALNTDGTAGVAAVACCNPCGTAACRQECLARREYTSEGITWSWRLRQPGMHRVVLHKALEVS